MSKGGTVGPVAATGHENILGMFRNPRENAEKLSTEYIQPSVGRPPSPPTARTCGSIAAARDVKIEPQRPNMATVSSTTIPTIGRGSTNPKKSNANSNKQAKGKPNGSILTFFKKAEDVDEDLFVPSRGMGMSSATTENKASSPAQPRVSGRIRSLGQDEEKGEQYHENGNSVKKRKLSHENASEQGENHSYSDGALSTDQFEQLTAKGFALGGNDVKQSQTRKSTALFMEDSDSDEESPATAVKQESVISSDKAIVAPAQQRPVTPQKIATTNGNIEDDAPPSLKREETSMAGPGDFADFQDMGDFEEDLFEEGDEFVERRWMEEQARLEAEQAGLDGNNGFGDYSEQATLEPSAAECSEVDAAPACPICNIALAGASDQDAAVHVNNCLDGKPTPLPTKVEEVAVKTENVETLKQVDRFRKVPRAPKPGQANPFTLGEKSADAGGSAFSKLMSGHAEDAAWADAAAAEKRSFGKPAYQRTCPFYKILPGFNICVDAFRYGAVEGCKAYFLSHFHSDHYVGLTAQWCHGPIYCSKVTANLVKQQLRVDPQYVVALDWETKVEVPGTNGVCVTMISANHCPGSSLYLYEKVVGRGPNPKVQRVLHCGDFRACRAHIEHPLLMPTVIDAISGKQRDQKIDVCYLDTTYLNPKYAFPSQEAVIQACADMCVSLSRVRADESDGWETMKRERAGAGMVKFIRKDSEEISIKQEDANDDEEKPDLDAMSVLKKANAKHRGRLLVVVGTYSIGKERICLGIARALKSKIYAPAAKLRICRALEDPELASLLTNDPTEAQVHMTPLFEIRADTLDDYLKDYKDHFARAVGFRPSGWNYRPPNSRFVESPSVSTVLHSDNWKSGYSMKELVPQRGSTSRASCFGVPYSEHSSFRELTMFCCALRIEKIIPTVNVGSAKSREKMKGWCERWMMERKKNGLYELEEDGSW
ncbi:DRMBL-domain-containing protein [Myriangium duriaei CBS 260.36]|uniref:DRMBL-domain-containing protein n=1 Tax=Myriangium duriaei CBS 260.36 TaxID=1168546 RepID=A0A9P4IZ62_9PEZI|nr:DRMBL-domain-containing protein [Myriangium duriaei CBS 260.36]